ncbi:MAG: TA system VapC family ribonuclease toxin [Acidimicrobiales bacterium]
MSRALFDVNVLLALLDQDHVDHARALEWMIAEADNGWASCAITENGFVRIISTPRYPNAVSPYQAMERLAEACDTDYHVYWPCTASLLDDSLVDRSRILGPRQVTDAYLLALATHEGGRFVTFDRSVLLIAARGATTDNLVVL